MNVAVFLPNWIGDVVMATPALRALRKRFVGARFFGVMKPYVAGVLEGSAWLDEMIPSDGWLAPSRVLRKKGIDLAVLFPNSFRSALTAWLGGCKRRVGYSRYGRAFLLTDALEPERNPDGHLRISPILDAYNRIAEIAGTDAPGHDLELFTTAADEQAASRVWEAGGFDAFPEVVCLNPGAAFGSSKYWPSEYFSQLAKDLVERRGCAVLVLCGPTERELAQRIADGMPDVYALCELEPKLSLGLTKACVRRADLLVTTDSGPRHFAHAFDRPVVTLFGPTHIGWTETYHPRAVHLQKKVDCGPCQLRKCPTDHRCMTTLTPGEVLHAAEDLLQGKP